MFESFDYRQTAAGHMTSASPQLQLDLDLNQQIFHPTKTRDTDRDVLEGLEASGQPDVDGGAEGGASSVEGVGHHQEMIRPHGEELPVIRSRCGQSLVHLKELGQSDMGLSEQQRTRTEDMTH